MNDLVRNEKLHAAILEQVKKSLPLPKRLFKKDFTQEDLVKIEKLRFDKMEILDLEFLKYFPNLKSLRLWDVTKLDDIRGLSYCPNLEELSFVNMAVTDWKTVQQCQQLCVLEYALESEYAQCGLSDFSFVKVLPNLELINVEGNQVTDVSMFLENGNLKQIILDCNPITTIAPLKALPNLSALDVSNCGLSVLEDLEQFPAMKLVTAMENSFTKEQENQYIADYPEIRFWFRLD